MPAAVVLRRSLAKDPANPGKNWVTETSAPDAIKQLPKFISFVAGALHRNGHPVGQSIAIAVGTCRRWAAGGGNVSATTRRRAAEAIAEWDTKRAQTKHGLGRTRNLSVEFASGHHVKGEAPRFKHGWIPLDAAAVTEKERFLKQRSLGEGHQAETIRRVGANIKTQRRARRAHEIAQATHSRKEKSARANARQAELDAHFDKGHTEGIHEAAKVTSRHGLASDEARSPKQAAADRAALVKFMREEEKREAAAVGHTGPIRHGGKAPKEAAPSKQSRRGPGRGRVRSRSSLSPSLEAERQDMLRRVAAVRSELEQRAKVHEQGAATARHRKVAARLAGRAAGHRHFLRRFLRRPLPVSTSNGGGMSIDLAGFKPSQQRAAAGTSTGGQWAAQGGQAPTQKVQSKKFKDWHAQQVGHYPPGMTDPAQRKQWDDWFRFFSLPAKEQHALGRAGKLPRKPKGAPRGPKRAKHLSNGGSVTQLNFADTEPDADDMMGHIRARVPKGHGMKVPDGTAPAKVAKLHNFLHRQGKAKHSHSGGKAMSYSLDRSGFGMALAEVRRDALEFAAQKNAGTVKGVAGTSPSARKSAASKGQAMPDGSYPVSNRALYDRARKALGRTNPAKRAKVRAFLTRVAKKKGWPPPGGNDADMSSLAHDGLVRALQLANLPHAQFPRVQTNPKPSTGVRHTLSSQRQPTTTTAKAGNEMFPPKARKGGGPGNSLAPYRQPKGASPPRGGPQAPLRLPKGSYEGMHIYTPANPAERSHVMRALRGARALRRQGRTAQANSVMAGLVRQVTGRARRMPSGQVRAHTIREVTAGLAQMAKGTHGITTSGSTGVKKGPPD